MKYLKIEGPGEYSEVPAGFLQYIEGVADRRELVDVVYLDNKSDRRLGNVRISAILVENGGIYMQFVDSGMELLIRLDAIESLNNRSASDFT